MDNKYFDQQKDYLSLGMLMYAEIFNNDGLLNTVKIGVGYYFGKNQRYMFAHKIQT